MLSQIIISFLTHQLLVGRIITANYDQRANRDENQTSFLRRRRQIHPQFSALQKINIYIRDKTGRKTNEKNSQHSIYNLQYEPSTRSQRYQIYDTPP